MCLPSDQYRWWNSDRELWEQADERQDAGVPLYLDADLQETCAEGARYWVAFS
eukprot:SAG31_NODE_34387_length_333_cov_1.128205_1_plen_52_part_10